VLHISAAGEIFVLEWLQTMSWSAVLQIIMIDLLLGGDNAVVIALATRNLNPRHRMQGVLWGTAGAIILRVVLIGFAVTMLKIPFLKLVGGLLLLWIGIKLLIPEDDDAHSKIEGSDRLWGAIKTIIIADFVMSLDNVIAIAGAAEKADPSHQLGLVIFGLLVSIPIIVFGSQLVLKLMDKYPWIVTAGAALLGWIAGGLLITDPAVVGQFGQPAKAVLYGAEIAGALFVVIVGMWLAKRKTAAPAA
jgi:YjbE family integral membrane protein